MGIIWLNLITTSFDPTIKSNGVNNKGFILYKLIIDYICQYHSNINIRDE